MILKAAIRLRDGSVFTGKRHNHCFDKMSEFYFPNNTWNATEENRNEWFRITMDEEQGFVTHTGEFVTRQEAAIIAKHYKQILPEEEEKIMGYLFSENIY